MSLVSFVLPLILGGLEPTGSGKFIVSFEPKHCLVDPCPQFRVRDLDGLKPENLYVDLVSDDSGSAFDLDRAKLRPRACLSVSGTWSTPDMQNPRHWILRYSKEPKVLEKKKAPCR